MAEGIGDNEYQELLVVADECNESVPFVDQTSASAARIIGDDECQESMEAAEEYNESSSFMGQTTASETKIIEDDKCREPLVAADESKESDLLVDQVTFSATEVVEGNLRFVDETSAFAAEVIEEESLIVPEECNESPFVDQSTASAAEFIKGDECHEPLIAAEQSHELFPATDDALKDGLCGEDDDDEEEWFGAVSSLKSYEGVILCPLRGLELAPFYDSASDDEEWFDALSTESSKDNEQAKSESIHKEIPYKRARDGFAFPDTNRAALETLLVNAIGDAEQTSEKDPPPRIVFGATPALVARPTASTKCSGRAVGSDLCGDYQSSRNDDLHGNKKLSYLSEAKNPSLALCATPELVPGPTGLQESASQTARSDMSRHNRSSDTEEQENKKHADMFETCSGTDNSSESRHKPRFVFGSSPTFVFGKTSSTHSITTPSLFDKQQQNPFGEAKSPLLGSHPGFNPFATGPKIIFGSHNERSTEQPLFGAGKSFFADREPCADFLTSKGETDNAENDSTSMTHTFATPASVSQAGNCVKGKDNLACRPKTPPVIIPTAAEGGPTLTGESNAREASCPEIAPTTPGDDVGDARSRNEFPEVPMLQAVVAVDSMAVGLSDAISTPSNSVKESCRQNSEEENKGIELKSSAGQESFHDGNVCSPGVANTAKSARLIPEVVDPLDFHLLSNASTVHDTALVDVEFAAGPLESSNDAPNQSEENKSPGPSYPLKSQEGRKSQDPLNDSAKGKSPSENQPDTSGRGNDWSSVTSYPQATPLVDSTFSPCATEKAANSNQKPPFVFGSNPVFVFGQSTVAQPNTAHSPFSKKLHNPFGEARSSLQSIAGYNPFAPGPVFVFGSEKHDSSAVLDPSRKCRSNLSGDFSTNLVAPEEKHESRKRPTPTQPAFLSQLESPTQNNRLFASSESRTLMVETSRTSSVFGECKTPFCVASTSSLFSTARQYNHFAPGAKFVFGSSSSDALLGAPDNPKKESVKHPSSSRANEEKAPVEAYKKTTLHYPVPSGLQHDNIYVPLLIATATTRAPDNAPEDQMSSAFVQEAAEIVDKVELLQRLGVALQSSSAGACPHESLSSSRSNRRPMPKTCPTQRSSVKYLYLYRDPMVAGVCCAFMSRSTTSPKRTSDQDTDSQQHQHNHLGDIFANSSMHDSPKQQQRKK
ncbi:hypothetical protein ACA910_002711 [Epithemia clementina (nom. ined.)]